MGQAIYSSVEGVNYGAGYLFLGKGGTMGQAIYSSVDG